MRNSGYYNIGSEKFNQKGIFRLLISERRLSSERQLMFLIRNLNVKSQYSFRMWDNFVTSHYATLPRLNEAGKPKSSLTQKCHHFNLEAVHISLTISYFL